MDIYTMEKIGVSKVVIPKITTAQMIEVDRLMMEDYKISLIQMMENAGRCLAILAIEKFLKKQLDTKKVIVLAGTGGNGGGALVCARRLHSWGVNVEVYLTGDPKRMTPVPKHQLVILQQIGLPIKNGIKLPTTHSADLIIDGIIGYSIKGNPFGVPKEMIDWANKQFIPILSLDTPSGLGLTTGKVHSPTIKATATLTLALPKKGLFEKTAKAVIGNLYLGDISVPPRLYKEDSLNIEVSPLLFSQADILLIKPTIMSTKKGKKKVDKKKKKVNDKGKKKSNKKLKKADKGKKKKDKKKKKGKKKKSPKKKK